MTKSISSGFLLIVLFVYFQQDPQRECRLSIMWTRSGFSLSSRGLSATVDGVDDWSYFDYVFGVVNGVYDLKYYWMVI